MTPRILEQLVRLYAEVDAQVQAAGPRCEQSGRCCRFTEWGHVLFLSSVEAEYLLATAPSFPRPVSSDGCPFQVGRLCTARESRPLGCRIYFCDPNYQETGQRIMEHALQRLKHLFDEEKLTWHYAPLHVFLNADPPEPEPAAVSPRVSLPLVDG